MKAIAFPVKLISTKELQNARKKKQEWKRNGKPFRYGKTGAAHPPRIQKHLLTMQILKKICYNRYKQ